MSLSKQVIQSVHRSTEKGKLERGSQKITHWLITRSGSVFVVPVSITCAEYPQHLNQSVHMQIMDKQIYEFSFFCCVANYHRPSGLINLLSQSFPRSEICHKFSARGSHWAKTKGSAGVPVPIWRLWGKISASRLLLDSGKIQFLWL